MRTIATIIIAVIFASNLQAQEKFISDHEKRFAEKYLHQALTNLKDKVESLDEKALNFQSAPDSWSILNCLEHISLAEIALLEQIKAIVAKNELDRGKDYSANDGMIISSITDRSKKVKTLKPLEPTIVKQSKQDLLDKIIATRQLVITYLNASEADLRHLFGPYPYGQADVYQHFLIIGAHMVRHTMQIEEILNTYQNTEMESKEIVAKKYFTAFHHGKLDEVYSYLAKDCVVRYGDEEPKEAKAFFNDSAPLIATLSFETKGVYLSNYTNKVLIDFSFTVPEQNGKPATTTNAIDIIEFDDKNRITMIRVLPN